MRLISLRVFNFRQFYGESPKITFAHGDRNITVIHGSNGAGKTALLNAFTWTLFDSLTTGFQLPDDIVNRRAIREAKEGQTVDAWVEIEFDHDDRKYIVKRGAQALRTSAGPGYIPRGSQNPTLQLCGPDGRWQSEERVFETIGRILPQDLHTFFFFDGERIEGIVKPTKKETEEIANATKKLLGIEILYRGEAHLDSVRRDLEKELRNAGDARTADLVRRKQELEEQLDSSEQRLDEIRKNIEAHEERVKEIEKRLRELKEVEDIQKRRDQLKKDKEARRDSLKRSRETLASLISSRGYTIFLHDPIDRFSQLIESLRQRGELPVGIKRQFVNDLLTRRICICKGSLEPGSEATKAVGDWMLRAGLGDVEEKAIRMGGEITKMSELLPESLRQIDQIQQQRELDRKELSKIEDELEDIAQKLMGSPKEEISSLQQQLSHANEIVHQLLREQGDIENSIRLLKKEIDKLSDEIGKYKANEEKHRIALKRVQAANESAHRIAEIRHLVNVDFRNRLQNKISKLFRTMSPTPYIPDLGEDYSLRLLDSAGGNPLPVAASQGESQILSLSFIGSIIEVARAFHSKQENLPGPEASSYPVVMDSPFGSLDSTYRHQIAEHLPALADQVVVLATKTQWRGEVERSMEKRLGRSYLLIYYTPRDDVKEETMEIGGRSFEIVKRSPNEFEYTEIKEILHARP